MSGDEKQGLPPSAEGVLSPLSLARLMDALSDPQGAVFGEEELTTLLGLLRRPLFHQLHAQLLSTAIDARMPRLDWDYLADAAESADQLDRLLAARGWQEPAAMIGEEVDHEQLLQILEARQKRGEGDPELLRLVERRLRVALEAEADARSGRSKWCAASAPERVSSRGSASLPSGPAGLPAQTCRPGLFSHPGKGRGAS